MSDVVIVGMAGIFPQAPDVVSFWDNVLAGVDAIGEPPESWGAELISEPDSTANDRLYTTRGGFLGGLCTFDPLEFGVVPNAIDGSEPEHFLALRVARDALADAGLLDRDYDRTRTAVILGRGTYVNRGLISVLQHTVVLDQTVALLRRLHPEYSDVALSELKADLKASLPRFNAETAPGVCHSVMCGRIANRLDLMGAAYTVDAACASSLIALDIGARELTTGACDVALCGGVQVSTSFPIAMIFAQLGALSRCGQSRPFHPDADGLLLGEAIGMVALRRREDAERDGDRIYAVVRGVGTASDGRAMGLLAPRVEGEALAMRRAYAAAGVAPETVGLVEAHGTGTPVGDAVELEALREVFGANGHPHRCALGSVKSMIGHSIPAAGAAGLIKTALALHDRVLPPTLHVEEDPPALDGTPLSLNRETRPWIHGAGHPRRAAVSAFGFGGIDAHAVLEEPDANA